jgi:hypothetical protein
MSRAIVMGMAARAALMVLGITGAALMVLVCTGLVAGVAGSVFAAITASETASRVVAEIVAGVFVLSSTLALVVGFITFSDGILNWIKTGQA